MTTTPHPTTITAEAGTPFLDVVRDFEAPRELVFRAAVDPELVAQWLGPRDLQMRIEHWDARTGGGYHYLHMRPEFTAEFRGTFHSVRPDELIVQTFEFDGAPDEVCLEFARYTALGEGRTRLQMHSVFPSVAARDAALSTGMTGGINESMDRLAELLAAGIGPAR